MTVEQRNSRFLALDGWRGICAIMIATLHFPLLTDFYYLPFVRHGWLFVDFFFVLSGFVITHAYGGVLRTGNDVFQMMVRRIGRLWPLHITMITVFVAIEGLRLVSGDWQEQSPFTGSHAPLTIVMDATFLTSWGGSYFGAFPWDPPSWSISAEFYTYATFAAVCITKRTKRAMAFALVALFAFVLLVFVAPDYTDTTIDFGFARCLYGFFIGATLYQIYRTTPAIPQRFATVVELGSIAVAAIFISVTDVGWLTLATPFVFGAIVLSFSYQSGALSRLLSGPLFQTLGVLSYSIYMVHWLFTSAILHASAILSHRLGINFYVIPGELVSFGPKSAMDFLAIIYLGLVIITSAFTRSFIELPGQRFFKRAATMPSRLYQTTKLLMRDSG